MMGRGNGAISALLVCLALIALFTGEWMTRPAHLGVGGFIVAATVIYLLVAGAPQGLLFWAALSCARQGCIPTARWWKTAFAILVMHFVAGASLIAAAITGEDGLLSLAAAILVLAALLAVASAFAAPRLASRDSGVGLGL
jgi:hypothetical protein